MTKISNKIIETGEHSGFDAPHAPQKHNHLLAKGSDKNYIQSTVIGCEISLTEAANGGVKFDPGKPQSTISERLVRYGHYDKLQG
jgi:hypothetical protein